MGDQAPDWVRHGLVLGLTVFLLQGLAVVHGVARLRQLHKAWLIALYILLFLAPQAALLLAGIGLVDGVFDPRRRLERARAEPDET